MLTILKRFFYYFLMCFSSFIINGQNSTKEYNFVSIKEGISKLGVSSIIQDHKGYIWLGTSGSGLHRFDGINYVSYSHILKDTTSISSSLIYCIYLDAKKRLWVGTEEGLNLYNNELDQFKRVPILKAEKREQRAVSVNSLQEDLNGNLLIGTSENGVFKLNLDTLKADKIPISGRNDNNYDIISVDALKIDSKGKILVGTNEGLLYYDSTLDVIKPINVAEYSLATTAINYIFIDNEDVVWLGSVSEGIFKMNKKGDSYAVDHFPLTQNRIFSIIKVADGTLFCGTENEGLIHFNSNGKILRNYLTKKEDEKSILSNSIWSLFVDNNERIWMGYYNSGVSVYDKLYDKFKNIESSNNNSNSLKIGSATGLIKDSNGDFWITMDGGGVDVYNPKLNKFTHVNKVENSVFSGITSDYLESIFYDSKQNIWIGSWDKGLFLLKKGANKFINFNRENTKGELASNTILSITEDDEGIIWFGTFYQGLHSFNPITNKITHYNSRAFTKNDLSESDIRKVLIDSKQNIWIGTTKGLFKIIKKSENDLVIIPMIGEMSEEFNNHNSANHILSLYESIDKKSIWIGTRGAGLCRYDTTNNTFTWYNKLNGLLEENITGIIEDLNQNLWLTGNSGVYKFDITTLSFINYTFNDGLLSNDFNMNANYRDVNGALYFGNYKGVDYFDPNNITTNTSIPSVYMTDFKLFNQKVFPNEENSLLKKVITETDEITLTHKQSVFTIEYSGINYTRPEKNQYAYYLEGLEDSWNYVGNSRSATYTNLDHGIYTFKLKSANNDGVWNEVPLSLKITILPPWWKSNWALFSYVCLFILGVYLLNWFMQSRIKEKESILNERKQREQEDKLNESKLQFFTNISHEFRTPLTLMINPLEDIINDESLQLPERVKEKHNTIKKNTYRLHRLINELMDFRKLEHGKVAIKAEELNLFDFTNNIVSYFKEEAYTKNIHLNLDSDILDLKIWCDEGMLEKIIFNILSNAFKVTPEGGAITIELLSKEELVHLPLVSETKPIKAIEIIISDTGPGLGKKQVKKIFDRFYQVENLNKTYYGGTGIGLEVVQNFVRLHKGEIKVESKVGKGTAFKILLPSGREHLLESEIISNYAKTIAPKEAVFKAASAEDKNHASDKNSNTLLIVEDNVELRNYLQEELKSQYKIFVASNGKEGLVIAKESLPDIIITDVIMPEMNGFEFCKNVKSDITTSHIPLLMLTAKAQINDRIAGIGMGADAYMVKPFDMRLLSLRLSQLITSRQLIFDKYFRDISGSEENANTTSIDKYFIQKVLSYINENIGDSELSVEILASELNLSRSQLYRKIKTLTGQSVNEFIRRIRLQKAKLMLESGTSNIKEVCYNVGFSSPSYFTKCFKSHFGILPTDVEYKEEEV